MTWHPGSRHGAVVLTNSHRGNPVALCSEAFGRLLSRRQVPASTITLWPETAELRGKAEELIRRWDDDLAAGIFAENIDFDRPLAQMDRPRSAAPVDISPRRRLGEAYLTPGTNVLVKFPGTSR